MEFKKGDKVLVTCEADGGQTPVPSEAVYDLECEVFEVTPIRIGVILPEKYEGFGHSLLGSLKSPYNKRGWYFDKKCCKPAPKAPKFWYKTGDKVAHNPASMLNVGVIRFVDKAGNCSIQFMAEDNPELHKDLLITVYAEAMEHYIPYKPEPKVTISITADPATRTTTATMVKDDELTLAKAKCNPSDKWDAMYGAQLAMRRLVDKAGATPLLSLHDINTFLKDNFDLEVEMAEEDFK